MRKPSSRRTVAALATLALTAAAPAVVTLAAGPAAAQTRIAAACTNPKVGVTEVVDFTKLGGKIVTACDPTDPKTGLAALKGAGFTYAFVPKEPGLVCTIDGKPNPCKISTTAYWSYWHAKPHGTWMFSSVGAGTYHPIPGQVEGWAFGDGKAPGISPP